MRTRILLGVKTPVCKADNLPPTSADVTESVSLNLPEPSGPVMGMLYVSYIYILLKINKKGKNSQQMPHTHSFVIMSKMGSSGCQKLIAI
jgi:hypothetical protein